MDYTTQMIEFLNPFELEVKTWIGLFIAKSLGLLILDGICFAVLMLFHFKKMSTRVPPIMKGLVRLEVLDWSFLFINQFIEFAFVTRLFYDISISNHVELDVEKISFMNIVPVIYAIFIVDDFFYYIAHRIMHIPALYPYIHKHHHRQALPKRGYFDAGNESPFEQIFALIIAFYTIRMVAVGFLGMGIKIHAVSVILFLALYATTAMLNHTEYDIKFGPLGLWYSVRAHEMHHRFPQCNYAQNFIVWDRFFGTYREFKGQPQKKVD